MDLEQAEEIVAIMEEEGLNAEVHEDYSGRGMYGSKCTGIVTDNVAAVAWAAGKTGMDWSDVPDRTDNMGKSDMIVY